jgi:CBS domain containing-hemolysin-like protein
MDYAVLVILILLSAVISAAEIGFFSVNETRLRAIAENGSRRAKMALHLPKPENVVPPWRCISAPILSGCCPPS